MFRLEIWSNGLKMEALIWILARNFRSRPFGFKVRDFFARPPGNLGPWIPGSKISKEKSLEILDLGSADPRFLGKKSR